MKRRNVEILENAKGISLVALVITIIVLVILVGVSIYAAINKELIGNSKTVVEEYANEQRQEEQHVQKVTELAEGYNGTEGKTASELYNSSTINDPNVEGYLADAMHIGDYVNYTAGIWGETVEAPTESTPFQFGGYQAGQSRDTNTNSSIAYEGWRIWNIEGDTVTLISAGCPERYYLQYSTNGGDITEYILKGSATETIDTSEYTARRWNEDYLNTKQYGSNAKAIEKSDLVDWYKKYITDSFDEGSNFPEKSGNKLISLVDIGYDYFLSTAKDAGSVWIVNSTGHNIQSLTGGRAGIRVLVTLTPNAKFQKSSTTVEKDGFSYNKWLIK